MGKSGGRMSSGIQGSDVRVSLREKGHTMRRGKDGWSRNGRMIRYTATERHVLDKVEVTTFIKS